MRACAIEGVGWFKVLREERKDYAEARCDIARPCRVVPQKYLHGTVVTKVVATGSSKAESYDVPPIAGEDASYSIQHGKHSVYPRKPNIKN
jgi:hypothetical protein